MCSWKVSRINDVSWRNKCRNHQRCLVLGGIVYASLLLLQMVRPHVTIHFIFVYIPMLHKLYIDILCYLRLHIQCRVHAILNRWIFCYLCSIPPLCLIVQWANDTHLHLYFLPICIPLPNNIFNYLCKYKLQW